MTDDATTRAERERVALRQGQWICARCNRAVQVRRDGNLRRHRDQYEMLCPERDLALVDAELRRAMARHGGA